MNRLSDIAIFVQVVDSGSFTLVAERLNISKSVISKYVSRLEADLGIRLLHRTTRKLSLTEAGQVFYQRCKNALQEIDSAESEISRLQSAPRGTLRINAPMSFGVMHLAPYISEFSDQYPDLKVDMSLNDEPLDMLENGFDVSLRIADLPSSSQVARRLGPCHHIIVASPAYIEQHGSPQTPDDLYQHNVITYQYQSSAHDWLFITPDKKQVTVAVTGSMQMNNSLALRETLLSGMGISRMPSFLVGDDIKAGRLLPLLASYKTLEMSIYLVFPERQHLSPKVRAFIEFMAEHITSNPYWDNF